MFSDKILQNHRQNRKLTTLVEQRTTYNADYSELNIFETHKVASQVSLTFDFPVIASMITGKKHMHLEGMPSFDFLPGESVIMPSGAPMVIDFPVASMENPTQCLALGIDEHKIQEVVGKFNDFTAIESENNQWSLDKNTSHLLHDQDINVLVHRLIQTFVNNTNSKDVLLDLMIQELVVRLLQTKAKHLLISSKSSLIKDSRMGAVIQYIKENLTKRDLSVNVLADKACMSASHFHRKFKNTLGISPIDYLNSEKIKFSKKLIKDRKDLPLNEVAFLSGFNNVSYFNRKFKEFEQLTPSRYKRSIYTT